MSTKTSMASFYIRRKGSKVQFTSLDVQLKEIMECFDFHKVQKVMKFLNWKWATVKGYPSIEKLKENATRLLTATYFEPQDPWYTACGGFEVHKVDGLLKISFSIESWDLWGINPEDLDNISNE